MQVCWLVVSTPLAVLPTLRQIAGASCGDPRRRHHWDQHSPRSSKRPSQQHVSRRDIERHLQSIRGGRVWVKGTGVWASEVRVSHGRVFFTEHIQNASACLGASVVRLENSPAITVCQTVYGFAEATRVREHSTVALNCRAADSSSLVRRPEPARRNSSFSKGVVYKGVVYKGVVYIFALVPHVHPLSQCQTLPDVL